MRNVYVHNKRIPIINIILLVIFLAASTYITVRYTPEFTRILSEPEQFRNWVDSYGFSGVFVFISLQILQVVFAAIPGEVVQIAGGYLYGVWLGTLYLIFGVVIGTVIVFYASRLLGYPLVKALVSQDKLNRLDFLFKGQKAAIVLFILFLLPGLPKDILSYIVGLTPVKPLKFFTIATVARFPALFVSTYIGANLQEQNYFIAFTLFAISVILFLLGYFYKDRLIDKIHRITISHKLQRR